MTHHIQEDGVVLGYAYQKLGRLSFPDEWANIEMTALRRKLPNHPSDLPSKRAVLEKRRQDLQERLDVQTQEMRQVGAEIRQQIQVVRDLFVRDIAQLEEETKALSDIPKKEQEFQFASRAYDIRDQIIDALDSGTLKATGGDGGVIQPSFWKDTSLGRVDWENSLAYFSGQKGYAKRKLVLLMREEVDEWIDSQFEPDDPKKWVVWRIKELAKGPPPKTKKALFSQLLEAKPKVTQSMFDSAWQDHAPSHWKQAGRRKD